MLGDYFYFCKFTSVCLDNNMKKQRDLFNPFSPFYLKERFEYLHSSSSYSLKSSENLSLIMPVQSSFFFGKFFTVQAFHL